MQSDTPVVLEDTSGEWEEQDQAAASFENGHLEASYVAERPKFTPRTAAIPIVLGAVLAFAGSAVVSSRKPPQSTDSGRFPAPIVLTEDLNPDVQLVGPEFDTGTAHNRKSKPTQRRAIDRDGSIAPASASTMPPSRKPAAAPKEPAPSNKQAKTNLEARTEDQAQAKLLAQAKQQAKAKRQDQAKQQAQPKQQVADKRILVADTQPPQRPAAWDEIQPQSKPSTASEPEQVASAEPEASPEPEVSAEPVAIAEPQPAPVTTPEPEASPEPEVSAEPVAIAEPQPAPVTTPDPVASTDDSSMASISVKDPFPMSVVIEPEPWFGEPIDLTLEDIWSDFDLHAGGLDDLASAGEPVIVEQESDASLESEGDVFAEMDQELVAEEPISLPDAELLALDQWPGEFQELGESESLPVEEEGALAQIIEPSEGDEFWLGPNGTEWRASRKPKGEAHAKQDDEPQDSGLSPEVAALLALSEAELEEQRRLNGLEVGPQLEPTPVVEEEAHVAGVEFAPEPQPELEVAPQPEPQPELQPELVAVAEPVIEPEPEPSVAMLDAQPSPAAPRDLLGAYSDWMRMASLMPAEAPIMSAVNGVPGSAYAPYDLSQTQGPLKPAEALSDGQGVDVALSSAPFKGGVLRRANGDHRWEGSEVPEHAISAERKLLTPNVGPVRIDLVDGQSLEGRLHSVGFDQLWLATSLGQISLERRRIAAIEKLDPGLGMPALHRAKDYSRLPHVRVVAKGGTFVGYQLSRDGNNITLYTDKGFRISLTDVKISPARQYRTVDLRRVEDYVSEKPVVAE